MANVFDVAKYILEQKGDMSAMKLQKLCYYCQAWSLVWDDEELFAEEFHAWENGPVCKELFYKTKGKFKISACDETGGEGNLSETQIQTINEVLDYYYPHDAQWLSRLTHLEKPWKEAREKCPMDAVCDEIITKASMAEYYGGL